MSARDTGDAFREKQERELAEATRAIVNAPKPQLAVIKKADAPGWPKPLSEGALYGLAGDIVRAIEPHSEGDPAAILIQFLTAFGNSAARNAFVRVSADRHHTNLFTVLVGQTARGRKGSSWSPVLGLMRAVDPQWADQRVQSGLSSGEGLIWAVHDPVTATEPVRDKNKKVTAYQSIVTDPGIDDKRLLDVEAEFASVLRVSERDGSTLSAIVRQAWDSGTLRILTKSKPAQATGAHISIIGHVTRDELLNYLTSTEAANGLANRFLWVCVKRSKALPEGGNLSSVDFGPITRKLAVALDFARKAGEIRRDSEATELWADVYEQLGAETPGMFGSVTSRAEAQTLRLSLLFALLDCSPVIRMEHLAAALEVWRYCEDSARFIFGDAIGDRAADAILAALRDAGNTGMTRKEMSDRLFNRNKTSTDIDRALQVLAQLNLAQARQERTGGRTAECWFAVTR